MYESILIQMCVKYVFLVIFTISTFYHENYFNQKLQKISTRNMYDFAYILSYIVVE